MGETEAQRDMGKQAKDVGAGFLGAEKGVADIIAAADERSGTRRGDAAAYKAVEDAESAYRAAPISGHTAEKIGGAVLFEKIEQAKAVLRESIRQRTKEEVGAFAGGEEEAIQRMQDRARRFPDLFGKVGADGRTGRQAVADLPPTQDEATRRAGVLSSGARGDRWRAAERGIDPRRAGRGHRRAGQPAVRDPGRRREEGHTRAGRAGAERGEEGP